MISLSQSCPWGKQNPNLSRIKLTANQRKWIIDAVTTKYKTTSEIAGRYNIKVKTIQTWVRRARDGNAIRNGPGRPSVFNEKAKEIMKEKLANAGHTIRASDFQSQCREAAEKALEDQGIAGLNVNFSKTTLNKFQKQLGVQNGLAEVTTDARALQCAEVLNQVSFAAMNHLMIVQKRINPLLILNFDGSIMTVGGIGGNKVKVKFEKNPSSAVFINRSKKALVPSVGKVVMPDKDDKSFVLYSVKILVGISAAGWQQPPVYILADDNMQEHELRHYKIQGLGVGTNCENYGWVIICKTRTCNDAFYRWYIYQVIKFIETIKLCFGLRSDAQSYVCCDGEYVQTAPIFDDEDIVACLKLANITVGKQPGSTTAINQPCDAHTLFKGTKAKLKGINDADVTYQTYQLDQLNDMFKTHNAWLNDIEDRNIKELTYKKNKNKIEMDPAHVKMAKTGLLRVLMAMNNCIKPQMIRESFQVTGQCPFNLKRIIENCKSKISTEQYKLIDQKLIHLSNVIDSEGEISELEYENIGILPTTEKTLRQKSTDDLVLMRRRSIILTHPRILEKERKYRKLRDEEVETRVTRKRIKESSVVISDKKSKKKIRLVL